MHGLADAIEELTADAVVLVDRDDLIIHWSARAARLVAIEARAALGQAATDVVRRLGGGPPDGVSIIDGLRRGEAWGESPDLASSRPRLLWTARPLHDADGVFIGGLYRVRAARVIDADEAVAAPAAPGGRPAVVGEAFEHAAEAMVVLDRQRRIVVANAAFRAATVRALGLTPEPGDDMLQYAASGTEAGFLDRFGRALAGERVQGRRTIVYPGGEEFEHVVEYTPLGGEGAVAHVLFGSMIGDRLQRPAPIAALLDHGLAMAPFGLLVADARKPDLPLIYVSPGAERLTGYVASELVGRNARVLQGRFTSQPALAAVRHALREGLGCDVVMRNEHKAGTAYWCRLRLTPVHDDLGVISHYIGIQEDVSEREHLMSRLRVADAQDTIQRMIGGAVHDLRNMLTVIAAQVGMAREDVIDRPEVVAALDETQVAVERATSLMRLLLAPVGRPGAPGSAPGGVLVTEVVASVAAVSRYLLPRGVVLTIDAPGAAAGVRIAGDRGALERVLLNLVTNAYEAMPSGGTITLRVFEGPGAAITDPVERQRCERGHWTLAVADDGPGMSPEVLARLFEPYFTTKGPHGTGLGLATCATLVRGSGGRLDVRSRVNEGTTVEVCLPVVAAEDHQEALRRASWSGGGALGEVLVVEPDRSVRASLSATLRRYGARVRDAGDVQVARTWAASSEAAAMLVLDAAAGLEEHEAFLVEWLSSPGRRALVLGEPPALDALRSGRVTYLPKPFKLDAFLLALTAQGPEPSADVATSPARV